MNNRYEEVVGITRIDNNNTIISFNKAYPTITKQGGEVHFCLGYDNEEKKGLPIYKWIHIKHEFIFDRRKVPKSFDGYDVREEYNYVYSDNKTVEPHGAYFFLFSSVEMFAKFVDSNFDLIKNALNITDRFDAIDALTGGYEAHLKKCEESFESAFHEHKEGLLFFNQFSQKVKNTYHLSDIQNKAYGYSISASHIARNPELLILGFVWSESMFSKNYINGFLSSQTQYVYNYNLEEAYKYQLLIDNEFFLDDLIGANYGQYSNFCYFNCKDRSELTERDINLCIPLFNDYLQFVNPAKILTFSSELVDFLTSINMIEGIDLYTVEDLFGNEIKYGKGFLTLPERKIIICFIPSADVKLRIFDRNKINEFAFFIIGKYPD